MNQTANTPPIGGNPQLPVAILREQLTEAIRAVSHLRAVLATVEVSRVRSGDPR